MMVNLSMVVPEFASRKSSCFHGSSDMFDSHDPAGDQAAMLGYLSEHEPFGATVDAYKITDDHNFTFDFWAARLRGKGFRERELYFPHCKALVDNKPPGVWEGQCGGVIDALVWVGSALPEPGHFCAPAHMPPSQAQRVVALYMERHPEKLHEDFKGLALSALTEAWPCEKK
jgi:hypothetical protein